jgi:hypothetical protein
MTEIAGDAALFVDVENPERAARSIAEQSSGLPSLREAGFRNLKRFETGSMIDRYLEFYDQVTRARGPV